MSAPPAALLPPNAPAAATANSRRQPTLRTKTGCFPCRKRRKKCDETHPVCRRCIVASTECQYPKAEELLDRRNTTSTATPNPTAAKSKVKPLCLSSQVTACKAFSMDLEPVLARHFVDKFYPNIMNPESEGAIHNAMVQQFHCLWANHKGVRYGILANAASHLYLNDGKVQLQERALSLYSKGLSAMSAHFSDPAWEANKDATLMAVILFYLHGILGSGTYSDVPYHLNAAIRILKQQFAEDKSRIIRHPPTRMAAESVLFSTFVVTMGCWSKRDELNISLDHNFWLQCEARLSEAVPQTTPSQTNMAWTSPIIGTPFVLCKLMLSIKHLYTGSLQRTPEILNALRQTVQPWISWALSDEDLVDPSISQDVTRLFSLHVSVLLDQLDSTPTSFQGRIVPKPITGQSPTLDMIVAVLERRHDDVKWLRCHQGNWPVYTAGYLVSDPDHIELVRNEMNKRWGVGKASSVDRYFKDLNETWSKRSPPPRRHQNILPAARKDSVEPEGKLGG